jgi:adenine deaminase
MKTDELRKLIAVAAGRVSADLVIRGGLIADVYTGRIVKGDLAVSGGLVAAIGESGSLQGEAVFDAKGQYLLPGFIDSHMHIESTFLSPEELGRLLLPHGTTTIIADPHEIVNVCGLKGLTYMLDAAEGAAVDIKFMLPSCVPASSFEHAGAVFGVKDMEEPLKNSRVLGLGEMMNYPGVINGEDETLEKLLLARNSGKLIDGHSPGLLGSGLNAYCAGGMQTDHECSSVEEMEQRLSRGMYVMLRQGSACRDLRNLIPGVTDRNSRRCTLCSDDLQPRSVFEEGHIDNDMRICVEMGIDPVIALRMATLNAAECFRLFDRGGLAPLRRADMVLVEDLRSFKVNQVFVKGVLAAEGGRFLLPVKRRDDSAVRVNFNVKNFSAERLTLKLASDTVYVIDVKAGSVVTGRGTARIKRGPNGEFVYDPALAVAKIAVVERHQNTGNVGLALIRGYGINKGALALSVAHDSHNIITVGVNDRDMACAVERLIAMGGGAALAAEGRIIDDMPLPLGGIMSDQSAEWVDKKLTALHAKAKKDLGVNSGVEPLMTLCFMALPVIPELKLTDMGLFDVKQFKFIPVEA